MRSIIRLGLLALIQCSAALHSIERIAAKIADPTSPRFRQFLTAQEAAELIAKQLTPLSYPPSSSSTRRSVFTKRSLSSDLERQLKRKDTCGADGLVTPACVRQVYGINYTPEPSRVSFAVYATEAASYNPQDLTKFMKEFRPEAQDATYEIVGSGDPAEDSNVEALFEVALDTQTLLGTAWPAKALLYNLGGVFGPNPGQPYKPFVDFLTGIIKNESVPSVVSFSESMPEDRVDPAYAKTLCTMMALAGARGVSLLFSSGDNGPNGDTSSGTHKAIFEPEFPASCPWVTAVGGTTNLENEVAATSTTIPAFAATFYTASGGGFSNLFDAPVWQKDVVAEYIAQHVPASYANVSGYNPRGRGIPDVSAFSTNNPTSVNGIVLSLAGTSASTPLWAAIVVLLNDFESSHGRSHLGFLNPWLYTLQSRTGIAAVRDITEGGNSKGGCNALAGCHLAETLGYDVAVGWDAVTGLGSPIFPKLIAALEADAVDCR